MDVRTHLNYQYPTTVNPAMLHLPQQMHRYQQMEVSSHTTTTPYIVPGQDLSIMNANTAQSTGGYNSRAQRHSILPSRGGDGHPSPAHLSTRGFIPGGSTSMSDKYIPSSSDKITCADHRPLDEIFATVYASSSGSRRLPPGSSSSRVPQPLPPSHRVPSHSHREHQKQLSKQFGEIPQPQGQPQVLTYPLPSKPQLKGVLQIPLHAVDNHMSGTDLIVNYRCSDWGIGVQMEGIPMTDLLYHHARGLERAHDRVLDGYGLTSIRFNIIWPYYPPFAKSISAFGTDGQPITRAGLGYEVSLAFAEFIYQISTRSVQPTEPNPYSIALSQPSLVPGGIKFEQLHLISVRNTSRGEWMAEVRAVVAPI